MEKQTYDYGLIDYITPTVTPLFFAPIGVSDLATRCCYSSYAGSDNEVVREVGEGIISDTITDDLHDAMVSPLVKKIVHAYQHESVLEHLTCSFLIQNTNRAVLQELSRSRIGVSLSVQSTRYTVSDIIKLFFTSLYIINGSEEYFVIEAKKLKLLNIADAELEYMKLASIYNQMLNLYNRNKESLMSSILSKQAIEVVNNSYKYRNVDEYRLDLTQAKNKRNAGDTVKAIIVDEMFNVDLVLTMNLRSLKHFLKLRDSGAAWKPMQVLAQEIKKNIPKDYIEYI